LTPAVTASSCALLSSLANSETELGQWAYTTEVENCSFTTEPFISFETDLNTLELLTLGLSCGRGESKAVTAKKGRRVVLKESVAIPKSNPLFRFGRRRF
jgi:hypothetical protein